MDTITNALYKDFSTGIAQIAQYFGYHDLSVAAAAMWTTAMVWGKLLLIVLVAATILYLATMFIFG